MAVSKNNVRVPITIPKELKQQLDKVAKEDKRTLIIYIYSRKSVYTGKGESVENHMEIQKNNTESFYAYVLSYSVLWALFII